MSLEFVDRIMSIKESEWKLPAVKHRFLKIKKNGEQRTRENEEPWSLKDPHKQAVTLPGSEDGEERKTDLKKKRRKSKGRRER